MLGSDTLKELFAILHEFYHHLRTSVDGKHKGRERSADEFARRLLMLTE